MWEVVSTVEAPAPGGGYSQGVRAGRFVYVSGQVPKDAVSGKTPDGGIVQQTRCALGNALAVVEASGGSREHVIKVNAYLRDLADFQAFDAEYRSVFGDVKPARTTVGAALAEGFDIEIDLVAVLPRA